MLGDLAGRRNTHQVALVGSGHHDAGGLKVAVGQRRVGFLGRDVRKCGSDVLAKKRAHPVPASECPIQEDQAGCPPG